MSWSSRSVNTGASIPGELRRGPVRARAESGDVADRAAHGLEQRGAARIRCRARRDVEQPRVCHQRRELDVEQVNPGQEVVGEPVRVRKLDRPKRTRHPHVALQRVRHDVVERPQPRLHPEPSDEPRLPRGVNREPRVDRPQRMERHPVDPSVDLIGPRRLLGGHVLDLRVLDRLEVRAPEQRCREPRGNLEHGTGRDPAVRRQHRGHRPRGHQRSHQRTERKRLDLCSRRARDDRHALGLRRPSSSVKVAGRA
jgi:hypothetical protein